ncbi:MAG: thioredoxin family protein [Chitinophagaceae bacterium]|nr:thioredoxin family protein [Chitinophagaceae bacterium]
MALFHRLFVVICVLAIGLTSVNAQDSTGALSGWVVKAQKTGEGKYELQFSLPATQGWQLYAPVQPVPDLNTTELQLEDSSVQVQLPFINQGQPHTLNSDLFGSQVTVYDKEASWKVNIGFRNTVPQRLKGSMSYSYGKKDEFYTARLPFTVELEGGVASGIRIHIPTIDINNPVADCGDTVSKDSSYFTIFILGFLGGLIALFTPCVFPMIPLTVSFFTKKSGGASKGVGSALMYGFFIFLIYILITIPFHIAGKTDADIFNNISTNVWLNLLFFVIFVAFALSFFGLYELSLPSGIANKADSKSGLGNVAGIFFMALTLAIVSFSCTGPILGTLLASVADGGAWPLTIGAAGFGLALGLPFALFALFPRWLQAIPKSGGWMTDLKVVLGFVELALAVKFLANADNVQQWGILKREVFFAAWIIIGFAIVAYLMGWLRIGHSAKPKKIRGIRLFFIVLFSAVTLYLIPGVTNTRWAKLGLISGFPPPTCYSLYANPVNCEKPLLDYEEALALARKTNKPVLIDFTGWACVNCRRMEENVWTNPEVERLMKEEFVLVSLYVDERTKLPASQRTVHTMKNGSEKSIITIGDRWTAFQLENFEATAQPQYAIVSPDEKALTKTKFYTDNPKEFAAWLECGLKAHKGRE